MQGKMNKKLPPGVHRVGHTYSYRITKSATGFNTPEDAAAARERLLNAINSLPGDYSVASETNLIYDWGVDDHPVAPEAARRKWKEMLKNKRDDIYTIHNDWQKLSGFVAWWEEAVENGDNFLMAGWHYSPENCFYVDRSITSLFVIQHRQGLPNGISMTGDKFTATIPVPGEPNWVIGHFDTVEAAFSAFCAAKIQQIDTIETATLNKDLAAVVRAKAREVYGPCILEEA